jgi:gliding motility-associated-like protein
VPLTVDAGPNQTACPGSPAILTATATGGYTSLGWSGGTGTFSNPSATTTSYTPGAGETGTVKIYCTIMKPCGTQTLTAKDSTNLTILQLPQATISASNGYSLCPGNSSVLSYTLNNAASAGTVTPGWSSPASSASTYTVSAGASPVTYTLNLTNSCGSSTNTFTIYPLTAPSASLSATSLSACAGSTVGLSATSNSGNYSWSVPAGATTASVMITANASATGVVTTTNSCGQATASYTLTVIPSPTAAITPSSLALCNGQSATLSAASNASGSYTWSTGATTSTISVNTAGVKTVSVSNQCGSATASSTVTIGGSPTIAIVPSPSVICSGQTATLTISGSVGTYSWSTGASSNSVTVNTPGVYSASVSNSCGSAFTSFTLSGGAGPTVSINPASLTLCNGQTGTLTATSNVSSYAWDNLATTSTISVSSSGIRTLTVTNQCGSATASATVTAGQTPSLTITATSTLVCPNEGATLTVSGGSMPYYWSHTSSIGSVVSCGAGTYSVASVNACGTGTASITIVQYTIGVSFTANPTVGVGPLVVTFTNTSTNANSYNWFFGNGNSSNAQDPGAQTYNNPGTYTVVLVGQNGNCEGYDTLTVTVLADNPYIIIPNVFTPNGDHVNDVFHVSALNIKEFHCTVYDRWGLEMFAWDDVKSGWDGSVSGKSASDGTYFYIIRAKDILDKEVTEKGTFILMR